MTRSIFTTRPPDCSQNPSPGIVSSRSLEVLVIQVQNRRENKHTLTVCCARWELHAERQRHGSVSCCVLRYATLVIAISV